MEQYVEHDSKSNILICLCVINLNECQCLQISYLCYLCYWYIYPLLLKSYSRFLGTGFRDHDAF